MVERIILMEHENVFLFEFGLTVLVVLKYSFRHNLYGRSLSTWRKIILIFAPIKDLLHVYSLEQPGQT